MSEPNFPSGTPDRAVGRGRRLGRAFSTALRPAGSVRGRPGAPPGIGHLPDIHTPPPSESITIRVMDYAADRLEEREVTLDELVAFLTAERPAWVQTRWIDLEGTHPWVVERLRVAMGIHPLAAEDVLHGPQRPAVDPYEDHLFVKARALVLDGELMVSEQISMFLFPGTLVSLQQFPADVWTPVRERIRRPDTHLRSSSADFLLYALLDAVVDHCFPLLERYGEVLERLEDRVLAANDPHILVEIQRIRRELVAIRRVLWPTREMVDLLSRQDLPAIGRDTQVFFRDVHSHAVLLLEIAESQRETCSGLSDLHMSLLSNRMNEVMKVLTIMTSLFIPVTFLAGVYGMNFRHFPELHWRWSYAGFWAICLLIVGGLLLYFRRRRWI